ncbi:MULTISPECIES: DUF4199 domain-containing protein [Hymenobacter]|uniref:DUF4199 domain-containing protein n=1 Tax=Hymenobacter TaxID=89966 RepID=UPI001E530B92|nr:MULTISPECIES: DUF4199 domain-containing protein [Hymenobacter]
MRTAIQWGVSAGIVCILWVIGLYLTGNNPYGPKRLMTFFIPPLAAILSQGVLRRKFQPEGPGLGRAIGVGLLTTFFIALVSAAGVYGFARITGNAPIQRHLSEMDQLLAASKADFLKQPHGLEQYERTRQGLARTPQGFAADDFKNKILFGLLISVPGGIFFRK